MSVDFSDERISAYLDGELTDAERAEMEALLASSSEHRQLVEELRTLRATLQDLPRPPLAGDFTERVLRRAIEAAAVAPHEGSEPAGSNGEARVAPTGGGGTSVGEMTLRHSFELRRWRRAFWSVAAVAAGLLGMLIVSNASRLSEFAIVAANGSRLAPMEFAKSESSQVSRFGADEFTTTESADGMYPLVMESRSVDAPTSEAESEAMAKRMSMNEPLSAASPSTPPYFRSEAETREVESLDRSTDQTKLLRKSGGASRRYSDPSPAAAPTGAAPGGVGVGGGALAGSGGVRDEKAPLGGGMSGFEAAKSLAEGAGTAASAAPKSGAANAPAAKGVANGRRADDARKAAQQELPGLGGAVANGAVAGGDGNQPVGDFDSNRLDRHRMFVVKLTVPESIAAQDFINQSFIKNGIDQHVEQPGAVQSANQLLIGQSTTQVVRVRGVADQVQSLVDDLHSKCEDTVLYAIPEVTSKDRGALKAAIQVPQPVGKPAVENKPDAANRNKGSDKDQQAERLAEAGKQSLGALPAQARGASIVPGNRLAFRPNAPADQVEFAVPGAPPIGGPVNPKQDAKEANDKLKKLADEQRQLGRSPELVEIILVIDVQREAKNLVPAKPAEKPPEPK